MVCTRYIVEASSKHRRHATSDHAVEAQRQQGGISAKLLPIQRVVCRVFRLWFEHEPTVFGAFGLWLPFPP